MDLLALALLSVFIAGVIYSTIFAYFEYRHERIDEYERTLQMVHTEVFRTYVWPLLGQRILQWSRSTVGRNSEEIRTSSSSTPPALLARRFYCRLRRALRLEPSEYQEYVRLCTVAMRNHSRWWWSVPHPAERIDHVCARYLFEDRASLCEALVDRHRWFSTIKEKKPAEDLPLQNLCEHLGALSFF